MAHFIVVCLHLYSFSALHTTMGRPNKKHTDETLDPSLKILRRPSSNAPSMEISQQEGQYVKRP